MTTIGLVLDLVLAGLLIATVVLAVRLHKKLQGLKGGHDELRLLVEGLNEATRRAQAGLMELRMAAEASAARLGNQVDVARQSTDELALLVASANNLADRLVKVSAPARPAESSMRGNGGGEPSLLRALRDVR